MRETLFSFLLLGIACIICFDSFGEGDIPTAKELYLLYQSASERIITFEVELEISSFDLIEGKRASEPKSTATTTMKYTKNGVYAERSETKYNLIIDGKQIDTVRGNQTYADRLDWSKRLVTDSPDKSFPSHAGHITPPGAMPEDFGQRPASLLEVAPYSAIFEYISTVYEKYFFDPAATVEQAEDGQYIVNSTSNGQVIIRLVLDPSKGYVPTDTQLIGDGPGHPVFFHMHVEKFFQYDGGIWLPHRYWREVMLRSPQQKWITEYKVIEQNINIDIPDDEIDISFPEGTTVVDDIEGTSYVIGRTDEERYLPQYEAQLRAAAEKAQREGDRLMKRGRFYILDSISIIVAVVLCAGLVVIFILRRSNRNLTALPTKKK